MRLRRLSQETKNILYVIAVALIAFEVGFQPIPLSVKEKVAEAEPEFVRTLTYEFATNLVGIPSDSPSAKDDEKKTSDEAKKADEKAKEPGKPLTRDDLVKEIRTELEGKSVIIAEDPNAIALPKDNRVEVKVQLPPTRRGTRLLPDEGKLKEFDRDAAAALKEKYSGRAGAITRVVAKADTSTEPDPNVLVKLGPVLGRSFVIERPYPRVKLGLDLQGGIRKVYECVPVSTYRYTDETLPVTKPGTAPASKSAEKPAPAAAKGEAKAGNEPAAKAPAEDTQALWQTVANDVKEALTAQGARVQDSAPVARGVSVTVRTQNEDQAKAYRATIDRVVKQHVPAATLADESNIFMTKDTQRIVRDVIQRRVDGLGLTEPVIQVEGEDRIVVEIPGKPQGDVGTEEALLEFAEADTQKFQFSQREETLPGGRTVEKVIITDMRSGKPVDHKVFLSDPTTRIVFTGADLKNQCQAQPDPYTNSWQVAFQLKSQKAEDFRRYTASHVGEPLLIVLNREVIMYPEIKQAIGGSGVIEGNFSSDEANQLAVFLNAGALPIPLDVIETQQVSATLGREAIDKSVWAGTLGFVCVVIFIIAFYRLPGVVAAVALGVYLLLIVATTVMLDATLTLHGIAGLILTVGMAVDANVLIFERLKEELRSGKSMRMAMEASFARAWAAILDGHMTTILAAIALLIFGTGGVRGFAISLIIGTICNLFTAVTITKLLLVAVGRTSLGKISWMFYGAEGRS